MKLGNEKRTTCHILIVLLVKCCNCMEDVKNNYDYKKNSTKMEMHESTYTEQTLQNTMISKSFVSVQNILPGELIISKNYTIPSNCSLMHLAASMNKTKVILEYLYLGKDPYCIDLKSNTVLHIATAKNNFHLVKAITALSTNGINYRNVDGESALLIAIKMNNPDLFKLILQKGGDPCVIGSDNATTLHLAVKVKNIDMAKVVLKECPNYINIQDENGATPLHISAEVNHTDIYSHLLNQKADPYLQDNQEETALHKAVKQQNTVMVATTLDKNKTGIDKKESGKRTALHWSLLMRCVEISELLLANGANPNETESNGRTPLHLASQEGLFSVVKHLMQMGVDINATDFGGYTPLHLAVYSFNEEIIDFLLNDNANPYIPENITCTTALHAGVIKKRNKIVDMILKKSNKGINIQSKSGKTAIFYAAMNDDYEISRILTDRGADPNIKDYAGMTPLHIVSKFGNVDIANLIIQKYKVSINEFHNGGFNALYIATQYKKPQMVQFLLSHDADTTLRSKGLVPLHSAAETGNLPIVEMILNSSKESINTQNYMGATPLYVSAYYNHTDVAVYLLRHGADPDKSIINGKLPIHAAALRGNRLILTEILAKTNNSINVQSMGGETVLHQTCETNSYYAVKFLIELGADPNIPNYEEWLPLHRCAQDGFLESASVILNHTRDINAQNNYGYTALMIAALNKQLEMVELLLNRGADTKIEGTGGQNIIHVAAQNGFLEVIELLRNKTMASLNLQDSMGFTPMLWAIYRNKTGVVEYLLKNYADVVLTNIFRHHVLHYAPRLQNLSMLEHIWKHVELRCDHDKLSHFINQQDIYGGSPLFQAASSGNEMVFFFLIRKGASMNIVDFEGQSLLHHAARGNNIKITKYILDNTAQTKYTEDYDKLTPIMLAASNRNHYLLEHLTRNETEIEGETVYGVNILHFAAQGGNLNNIIFILNKTRHNSISYINTPDSVEGYTPIMIAASQYNNQEAVRYLMDHGADPLQRNAYGEDAVILAAKFATVETLHLFQNIGYDADKLLGIALGQKRSFENRKVLIYLLLRSSMKENPLFFEAATHNDDKLQSIIDNITIYEKSLIKSYHCRFPKVMEQFLSEYEDTLQDLVDDDDKYAPSYNDYLTAVDVSLLFFGKLSTVDILVKRLDFDIENECKSKKWSPLDSAIYGRNLDLLDYILNKCNSIVSKSTNKYGWTAMHKAVWAGNDEILATLKKYGVSYSQPDRFNRTPLHIAAIRGNRFLVALLSKVANNTLDSSDVHGFTPLHLVIIYSQGRFFNRLSTASSDLSPLARHKLSSLGIEKDANDYQASALVMMKNKANLNIQDNAFGWTPLHWAAAVGEEAMVHMLVSRGAKVNAPSWDDETPMKIARKWNRRSIYSFLKSKGAVW